MKYFVILMLLFNACSKGKERADLTEPNKMDLVQDVYDSGKAELETLENEHGWISSDCDAMIWEGERCATPGIDVGIDAAEFPNEPGRYGRRAVDRCWENGKNLGADTTWSRDMAAAGLFPCAWKTANMDLLEAHAAYGKSNFWVMGEPLADGRAVYTPQIIGLLYQMIFALGGEDSLNRLWPSLYTKGLDDFKAHLQVKQIWLRGDIAYRLDKPEDIPKRPIGDTLTDTQGQEYMLASDGSLRLLTVSETMWERLKEHFTREPQDPFYAYVWGLYSGNMQPAIDAVLNGDVGSYVRCGEGNCVLAHRIFVAGLLLESFDRL